MNWDAIGAIGEIMGTLAVGATLIYLAIQIKQVQKDLHVSTYRELSSLFIDVSGSITPELARIIVKNNAADSLEDWEKLMLDEYFYRLMEVLEVSWDNINTGVLDIPRDTALAAIRANMKKPGLELWWNGNRNRFFESWQRIVDECFSTNDSQKDH